MYKLLSGIYIASTLGVEAIAEKEVGVEFTSDWTDFINVENMTFKNHLDNIDASATVFTISGNHYMLDEQGDLYNTSGKLVDITSIPSGELIKYELTNGDNNWKFDSIDNIETVEKSKEVVTDDKVYDDYKLTATNIEEYHNAMDDDYYEEWMHDRNVLSTTSQKTTNSSYELETDWTVNGDTRYKDFRYRGDINYYASGSYTTHADAECWRDLGIFNQIGSESSMKNTSNKNWITVRGNFNGFKEVRYRYDSWFSGFFGAGSCELFDVQYRTASYDYDIDQARRYEVREKLYDFHITWSKYNLNIETEKKITKSYFFNNIENDLIVPVNLGAIFDGHGKNYVYNMDNKYGYNNSTGFKMYLSLGTFPPSTIQDMFYHTVKINDEEVEVSGDGSFDVEFDSNGIYTININGHDTHHLYVNSTGSVKDLNGIDINNFDVIGEDISFEDIEKGEFIKTIDYYYEGEKTNLTADSAEGLYTIVYTDVANKQFVVSVVKTDTAPIFDPKLYGNLAIYDDNYYYIGNKDELEEIITDKKHVDVKFNNDGIAKEGHNQINISSNDKTSSIDIYIIDDFNYFIENGKDSAIFGAFEYINGHYILKIGDNIYSVYMPENGVNLTLITISLTSIAILAMLFRLRRKKINV